MLFELVSLSDQVNALNVFRYITFRTGGAIMTALLFRSEEHTSESSHLGTSYAVFCLKKKSQQQRPCALHHRIQRETTPAGGGGNPIGRGRVNEMACMCIPRATSGCSRAKGRWPRTRTA